MSKALKKITGSLNNASCSIIFINQIREKVGIMFGNPETTPGGRALKFYSTVRLEVRRGEAIKNGTEMVGNTVNVKVVKNKVAPPFKSCSLELVYGKGLSKEGEILDLAVKYDIVNKSGAWYEYDGNKIGQGRENAKKTLLGDLDLYASITQQVKEKIYSKE
jgi:recombination protein RecA